jgi:glycosyltransferase involved in cell wall biosynthesis
MKSTFSFSIITINLNDAAGLEKTINSVVTQSCNDFEFIVIDGGSTDNSPEIIEKYKSKIHYSISEKDTGIYNAMNKGILKASGKYCLFLNSGDFFVNNVVLQTFINGNYTADIITGGCLVYDHGKSETVNAPVKISFYTFYRHTIIHQATFIKLDLFSKIGLYDENLKIVADWEFFIRAFGLQKATYQPLSFLISSINTDGMSSAPENSLICKKEREMILEEKFAFFLPDYELIRDPTNYNFICNIQKYPLLNSIFHFVFRVINRIAR